MSDFFKKYKAWESERHTELQKGKQLSFTDSKSRKISLPFQALKRLNGNVNQLNPDYKSKFVAEADFYRGEEPNYNVILKHYDVEKKKKIEELKLAINGFNFSNSRLVPIFFLTGSFGSGKSTLSYRLIHHLLSDADEPETVAVEIINPYEVRPNDLQELFQKTDAKRVILYCNTVDLNSTFKALLELRNRLSVSKESSSQILIICSVRENMLEVQLDGMEIKNSKRIQVDCKLNRLETEELVERLKNAGVIEFRDLTEKEQLVKNILHTYDGDSFVALLQLITNNKHLNDLIEAFDEAGKEMQEALLYTSLLYQYSIMIPASLLKSLVSKDWEDFRKKILPTYGKGLLIQEEQATKGSDPDLFFRTKHPVISQKIVELFATKEDKRYELFEDITKRLVSGAYNSRLLINLFKAIRSYESLPSIKINRLYDIAGKTLSEEPHFLLHYAINLQSRGDEKSILEAIDKIIYAESLSPRRDHKLIHRRGVLYFELAKITYTKENKVLHKTLKLLDDAREMFLVKRKLDPCTAYGYFYAIKLELWHMEKVQMTNEQKLQHCILIEELFDTASRTVFENIDNLEHLKDTYNKIHRFSNNEQAYLDHLQEYLEDSETRPYALTLLFNHYLAKDDFNECENLLPKLEYFSYKEDVLQALFKFYGKFLHLANYRIKFYSLIRNNQQLEDSDSLRYNYFRYVAASYDKHFDEAYKFQSQITDRFNYLNPEYQRSWIDPESGAERIFECTLKKNQKNRFRAYISHFSKEFPLNNFKEDVFLVNNKYSVKLHFYLNGIFAEFIKD